MGNRGKMIKSSIFILFILLLFLPTLQKKFPNWKKWKTEPLVGIYHQPLSPIFNWKTWLNGSYQTEKEKYIEETIGLREPLVRIYNEYYFRFFTKINARDVILGKNDYLFEKNYIRAYYGDDFIGEDSINTIVRKYKAIEDTLLKMDIPIFVLLAPGKATYMPENIPDSYRHERKQTNYETYVKAFQESHIKFLDVQQWFLEMRSTSKYPLYSQRGIHWSYYAEVLATDSLLKFMQKEMPNYYFRSIEIDTIIADGSIKERDNDLELGMNLFFRRKNKEPLAYPQFHFSNPEPTKTTPRILVIADSFYWGIYNVGLSRDVFNDGEFWYYNEQIYQASVPEFLPLKEENAKERVEKHQGILIVCTDANLYRLGFGFIEQMYDIYFMNQK